MDSDILNSKTFELTLDQQFQVTLFERQATNMSREQLEDLVTKSMRMLMMKDNIIRDLVKNLA